MIFEFVSKVPYKLSVRLRPSREAPALETVREYYRFRKFDCKMGTDSVVFLLQQTGDRTYVATVWRDSQLTPKEEEAVAKSVFDWLEDQRKAKAIRSKANF
jgi:hypothetical protein